MVGSTDDVLRSRKENIAKVFLNTYGLPSGHMR